MPDNARAGECVIRVRKKPFEVDAVQFTGTNYVSVWSMTGTDHFHLVVPEDRGDDPTIVAEVFDTLHSTWVGVHVDDWIIRGVKGEFYPCKPDVFTETYEVVQ